MKLSLRRMFGHGGDESADAADFAADFDAHGFIHDMHSQRVDETVHANLGAYSLDCC